MRELPWVEKYRPNRLEDVITRNEVVETMKRLTRQSFFPHLLLFGPPGTGKTSAILAVAKELYGADSKNMVLELNASDDRGIGVVREQIQDSARSTSLMQSNTKFKMIILDECDNMTKDAQMALRRIMEDFTKNVRFCLMCNHPNSLLPAIRSRCAQLRFPPLQHDLVKDKLIQITAQEKMKIEAQAIDAMIKVANGDMRTALNTLQFLHLTGRPVLAKDIYEATGKPSDADIQAIVQELLNSDYLTIYNCISRLQTERGFAMSDLVQDIGQFLMEHCALPDSVMIELLMKLGDYEMHLSGAANEDLQLLGLIGNFIKAREEVLKFAQ